MNQDKESNKGEEIEVLQNATTNSSEMDKEQQELYNAVTENMTAQEKTELDKEMGNSSKVKSILIVNIASIGILLITVISFAIFHFKRKPMNVDTEGE